MTGKQRKRGSKAQEDKAGTDLWQVISGTRDGLMLGVRCVGRKDAPRGGVCGNTRQKGQFVAATESVRAVSGRLEGCRACKRQGLYSGG